MKKFLLLIVLPLTACSTAQNVDFNKLKSEDRVYTGKVLVDLNGKQNKDLSCDLFLNIDLNPIFRVSPDGLYYFKTSRTKLDFGKIACIYTIDKKDKWIYHDIDVKKIKKSEDENTITSLGIMTIRWKINPEELEKPATKFADSTQEKIENVGKFKIEFKPNLNEQTQFMQQKFPVLKENQYKFSERLFELED